MYKRFLNIIFAVICVFCFMGNLKAENAYTYKVDAKTRRIPAGNVIEVETITSVDSSKTEEGEDFDVVLTQDIKVDSEMILPRGTIIRGRIDKIIPRKRLSQSAILFISFEHIVTALGKQLPLDAAVCNIAFLTDEGGIAGGGNYGQALKDNWSKTSDIYLKSLNWGYNTGSKYWDGYAKYVTTPIAAFGGAVGGGAFLVGDSVADLFKKGKNVVLPLESKFTIILLSPLDIPVF